MTTNTSQDPTNPCRVKAEVRQSPLKKTPTHMIIGLLHIKFDRHEIATRGDSSKIMHKLLGNKYIIGNVAPTNKMPLL